MIRSWEEYLKFLFLKRKIDFSRYLKLPKEPGDKKYDKIKIVLKEYKKKLINTIKFE